MPIALSLRRLHLGAAYSANLSSPARIAALLGPDRLAHWDSEEAGSITRSGAAVTGLRELVGGTTYAPGTAATRPNYSATAFNGRPGIVPDGVDDYLAASEIRGPSGASACEMWALASQDILGSVAGYTQIVGYGSNTTVNTSRCLGRIAVSSVNRARVVVGTGAAAGADNVTTVDLSGIHVLRGVFGATSTSFSVDGGTPVVVAAVPATAAQRTVLFAAQGLTTGWWSGAMSAVLITNPLSTEKAATLLALLQERYL
jgi:hypothetical protein